jgi:hypothetical protein
VQNLFASGVTLLSVSRLMCMVARGGGFSVKGWVGEDCSPGMLLLATGRSS